MSWRRPPSANSKRPKTCQKAMFASAREPAELVWRSTALTTENQLGQIQTLHQPEQVGLCWAVVRAEQRQGGLSRHWWHLEGAISLDVVIRQTFFRCSRSKRLERLRFLPGYIPSPGQPRSGVSESHTQPNKMFPAGIDVTTFSATFP